MRLGTIFDEWIALTDTAPVNTLTEVLHILEMLHPKRIEYAEVYFALNFTHGFFADFEFLIVIELFDGSRGEFDAVFFFAHETNRINEVIIKIKDTFEIFLKLLVNT